MNKQLNKLLTARCKSPLGGFRGLLRGLLSLLLFLSLLGCKEEGRIDHIDSAGPAPAQIDMATITWRGTPGGAVLKYRLPADIDNLHYVKAEYELQSGVVRQTKASCYEDSLVLDGFGDTRTYEVKIYSVGKNEKASEPVTVSVTPTTAPVHMATANLKEAFGGVSVVVENPMKATLAIELMGDTAQLGYQTKLATFYISKEKQTFNFRGLDTIAGNFSVYMRDRWNNLSETGNATLTPWYEEFIPKNTWRELILPTDREAYSTQFRLSNAWNGNITSESMFVSTYGGVYPFWFTWDLGVTIIMSRLTMYWTPTRTPYTEGMLKDFELYGSINPTPDGSWDENWIPLGRFECLRPSGLAISTDDDIAFARQGFGFDLETNEFAPDPFVPIRYIRIKANNAYHFPSVNCYLQEISFWGLIQK